MKARWLGRLSYDRAHEMQVELRDALVAGDGENMLLLLEHDPVVTFGRRGPTSDLLVSQEEIERQGIAIRHAERGGQTTYHGPGQLVGYLVARLHDLASNVPEYVWRLEESMIRSAAQVGVPMAERCHCGHGVFVEERKLGFIGIAVSRGICWHGFALNVNMDLAPFSLMRPCGLDVDVTSIAAWTTPPSIETMAVVVAEQVTAAFQVDLPRTP